MDFCTKLAKIKIIKETIDIYEVFIQNSKTVCILNLIKITEIVLLYIAREILCEIHVKASCITCNPCSNTHQPDRSHPHPGVT